MKAGGPAIPSSGSVFSWPCSASTPRPGCRAAARPDDSTASRRSPGRTGSPTDLITLQERWEDYLDEQDILDFATIQHRFQQCQAAIVPHLDHVFVDEFQDTNPIQFAIHLAWLARPETRLTVVGDDDQALYRFRGSDITCFTGLENACREAGITFRQEKLEQNWRSSSGIVAFTGAFRRETVLAQVSMPKTVRAPGSAPPGEPPRLLPGRLDCPL